MCGRVLRWTLRLQYPGCVRRAKYGLKNAQPSACQAHKRAGQYTVNRQGEMMIATRDGDGKGTGLYVDCLGCPYETSSAIASPHTSFPPPGVCLPFALSLRNLRDLVRGCTIAFRPTAVAATGSPAPSSGTAGQRMPHGGLRFVVCANRSGLLSSDQADGRLAAQNHLCLFPGCKSLPEYGLPGAARAVYCLLHKKGAMVCISKETPVLQSDDGLPNSSHEVAPRKPDSNAPPAEASAPEKKKKARGLTIKNESGAKKARHGVNFSGKDDATCNRAQDKADEITRVKDGRDAVRAGSGLKPTVVDSTAAAATKTASPRMSVSGSPPANRKADAAGMAPSAEMTLVRQAREAAKKEAEAAGGGRRPRAPSRRALEASGRLTDEGAQWMTRERKEEEVRVNAELREQRKQYRAAGLRVGVVLEAFVPGALPSGAIGSGDGTGVGDGGGEVGGEGATPRDDTGWHKVSPAVLAAPLLQAQTTDR
ncbi:unnamed protein product, partial [Hapterophycus canaliculatus]